MAASAFGANPFTARPNAVPIIVLPDGTQIPANGALGSELIKMAGENNLEVRTPGRGQLYEKSIGAPMAAPKQPAVPSAFSAPNGGASPTEPQQMASSADASAGPQTITVPTQAQSPVEAMPMFDNSAAPTSSEDSPSDVLSLFSSLYGGGNGAPSADGEAQTGTGSMWSQMSDAEKNRFIFDAGAGMVSAGSNPNGNLLGTIGAGVANAADTVEARRNKQAKQSDTARKENLDLARWLTEQTVKQSETKAKLAETAAGREDTKAYRQQQLDISRGNAETQRMVAEMRKNEDSRQRDDDRYKANQEYSRIYNTMLTEGIAVAGKDPVTGRPGQPIDVPGIQSRAAYSVPDAPASRAWAQGKIDRINEQAAKLGAEQGGAAAQQYMMQMEPEIKRLQQTFFPSSMGGTR